MGSSHVPVYAPMVVSCLSYHPGNISGGRHSGNPVDGKKQDTACEIIQQCFDTENNTLGHPIGATGAMRLTTLINEMVRSDKRFGLETICGGGGQGICMVIERK